MLSKGNRKHLGSNYIRTAHDSFKIPRQGGDHWCLVQEPMYDSMDNFLARVPDHRLPPDMLRMSLFQIFVALDYVHKECRLVHTGQNLPAVTAV